MIFYKILDFKYKGKSFTSFRNELGYKTYLQYRDEDGKRKYSYVDFETYVIISDLFSKRRFCYYDDGNLKIKKQKYRFIPKVLVKMGTILMAVSLLASDFTTVYASSNEDNKDRLWPYKLFDRNEVILNDDYEVYEVVKSINLLTADGLELYWTDEKDATFDDLRIALSKNKNLDDDIVNYLTNFIDALEEKIPTINLACFYYNLKNLKMVGTGTQGMMQACGSSTATACFLADDCTLYYNRQLLNEKNFDYIMYHEIGHMLVNGNKRVKGYETERHFTTADNCGFMIEEGFNTLLIEYVMGIHMDDVSYRLPANYIDILMNTVDYSFEDYVAGNHIEFENSIKRYFNTLQMDYDVDVLPSLMEYQKYNVRQGQGIEMDDSEFSSLYEIIAAAYFNENIPPIPSERTLFRLYNDFLDIITDEVTTKEGDYVFDFTAVRDTFYQILKNKKINDNLWPDEDSLIINRIVSNSVSHCSLGK